MMASNGHFCGARGVSWATSAAGGRLSRALTQMPQPMHSSSDKYAILEPGFTSIQSLP